MSKGLGKVERGILEAVKSGKCEASMITCFVYGLLDEVGDITEPPSMAQHKSTLRALTWEENTEALGKNNSGEA